jgi:hypothetical protein
MAIHPLAGSPAPSSILIEGPKLLTAYSSETPDVMEREQRVDRDIGALPSSEAVERAELTRRAFKRRR